MSEKIDKCLLCGSSGYDMVFKFYCSNSKCQNYKKIEYYVKEKKEQDGSLKDLFEILNEVTY